MMNNMNLNLVLSETAPH